MSFYNNAYVNGKLKPIFHQKKGWRWVPDANEIYTKNMKCTCPTPAFCVGTQRNLYSTGWRRGLASGKTQILALGNAKIYQHVGISNAKFWRRGHCPTPAPDARYFAFWWNIGFKFYTTPVVFNLRVCIVAEGNCWFEITVGIWFPVYTSDWLYRSGSS